MFRCLNHTSIHIKQNSDSRGAPRFSPRFFPHSRGAPELVLVFSFTGGFYWLEYAVTCSSIKETLTMKLPVRYTILIPITLLSILYFCLLALAYSQAAADSKVEVPWSGVLSAFAIICILAALTDSLIRKLISPTPSVWIYITAILICFLIPAIPAANFSKNYWGYYFTRPGLLPSLSSFSKIEDIVNLDMGIGTHIFEQDIYSISKEIERFKENPYYSRDGKAFSYFIDRGILSSEQTFPKIIDFSTFHHLIKTAPIYRIPDKGYEEHFYMNGFAITGQSATGQSLLYLSIFGGQVSNDHHPFYELLFNFSDGHYELIDSQVFYVDVAGIEGMEFGPLAFFGFISIIVGLTLFSSVILGILGLLGIKFRSANN